MTFKTSSEDWNFQSEEPDTIAFKLYRLIKADIRSGKLEPGIQLRTEWLKATYQTSVSPCREALSRLAAEKYVVTEGKKGFRVRELSLNDYINLVELRSELEHLALRKTIENNNDDWDDRLVLAYHRLAKTDFASLKDPDGLELRASRHREFHLNLISGCGSPWLLDYFGLLSSHLERYRRIILVDVDHGKNHQKITDNEHLQLMTYAQEGKTELATELLEKHRAKSTNRVLDALKNRE